MSEYSEKLKDPRWQRKRLEILQRDNFTCRICGCNTQELHVHHLYYNKGKEPWEYSGYLLTTLCQTCHEIEHSIDLNNDSLIINHILGIFNITRSEILKIYINAHESETNWSRDKLRENLLKLLLNGRLD